VAQRKIKTYRDLQVLQKPMTLGKLTMRLCAFATLCLNSIKFVYDNKRKNISEDQRRSAAESLYKSLIAGSGLA
jgi:hypothetical protein